MSRKALNMEPVSVIVVLYHSHHLVDGLVSNFAEKMPFVNEFIFVDNASTEPFEKVIDGKLYVSSGKNLGYGAAVNFGVSKSQNKIVLIANPDVRVLESHLDNAVWFEKGMVISGLPSRGAFEVRAFPKLLPDVLRITLFNTAKIFSFIWAFQQKKRLDFINGLAKVDWVTGGFFFIHKVDFDLLGGFDETYFLFYEELDLFKRASERKIECYITKSLILELNAGTASNTDVSTIKSSSEIKSFRRYHNTYSGRLKSVFSMVFIKTYSVFVSLFAYLISFAFKTNKLRRKAGQFFNYLIS